jgi:chemotaxis protein MotB
MSDKCHCEEGLPEWIMSYADMITILMAFFVVMYSMAGQKDTAKEEAVMASLRMWFGGMAAPWPDMAVGGGILQEGKGNGPRAGRSSIPANLRRPVTAGHVIYFSALEKNLTDEEKERIRQASESLSGKRHLIEIRGRPSRRPLPAGSHYRDQVDLTWDKCRQTRDYLASLGIEPERIQMVVSTASAPGGATEDPQLLTHDSRVDLLLLGMFLEQPKASSRSLSKPGEEPVSGSEHAPAHGEHK